MDEAEAGADDRYESCEWIEGGLAFNRRSLHSCLIVHHHTGLPFVADYNGGEIPLETLLAVRERIRAANRTGVTHFECRKCPHLRKQAWPRQRYPIEIVGIAHYSYCNIKCSYCFLQTQNPASFADGFKPYSVLPVVRKLIADGQLAPHAIIDWGGGEPTSYPEFDELLELLLAHGTYHYVHTNGTRFPAALRRAADPSRVHVICSVDAGLPETYVRIKQKDYLERVWGVLGQYVAVGAVVTLKYIVKEENRGAADLNAFVARAAGLRPRGLIVDFDYDFPDPGPGVVAAMGRLRALARAAGVPARFGFTGSNFAPEHRTVVGAEAEFRFEQERLGRPPAPAATPRARGFGLRALVRRLVGHRGGQPTPAGPDRVTWINHDLPSLWFAGGVYRGKVVLRNGGARGWPCSHPEGKTIDLAVLVDGAIQCVVPLPFDVGPNQKTTVTFDVTFPAKSGGCEVKLALVEQNVAWLEATGAVPLTVRVRILPAWTPEPEATESPDAAPQTGPDKPARLGRRLWNLPIAPRSPKCGD